MSAGNNNIEKLLRSPTKGAGEATGMLSNLYRRILFDLGIGPGEWNRLMLRWIADPKNAVANTSRAHSSERGNIIKQLSEQDMTWKIFLRGIRYLSPLSFKIEVHLRWKNRPTTIHSIESKVGDGELDEE